MKIPTYEMNRKNFALTYLGAIPALMILVWPLQYVSSPEVGIVGGTIAVGIGFAIMLISILRRLDNIGKSKLWFLGLFVPLLNLYILPMIWSYPPNIKENGMDKKGYFIFILVLLIAIALMLLRIVIDAANAQGLYKSWH